MTSVDTRISNFRKNLGDLENHTNIVKLDNPTNFEYIPIDYSLYTDINDLPLRTIDPSTNMVGLPDFIFLIFRSPCIKVEGKTDFFLRFGIYYATDPEFRLITDKYTFLFLDGLYYGAYSSEDKAVSAGFKIKEIDGVNYPMFTPSVHIKTIGVEYKEVVNTVSKSKILEIRDSGKIVFTRVSEHYKLNISLLNDKVNTTSEQYMLDTGASVTHSMYQDYIRSDNYEYSEYPFTEDNELIIDENKRKPELELLNRNIIRFLPIKVKMGNNVQSPRIQIFYGGDIFYVIEEKIKIHLLSSVCRYFISEEIPDELSISNILTTVVRSISPPKKITSTLTHDKKFKVFRGEDVERLIGMDNISQVNLSTTVFNQNINILSISLPENDNLLENEFKVMLFLAGLKIYVRSLISFNRQNEQVPINYKDSLFYFGKENLFFGSFGNELYQSIITNRPINLILINENHYNLQNYISDNSNIDGWISNTKTGYEIWLKDVSCCQHIEDISYSETIIDKKDYSFLEDIKAIMEYNVTSWKITI